MTAVDLMIFDFDGTLVDTGEDLANRVNHTLRAFNLA
jgi:phosphoglycolate phosphatase